MVAIFQDRNRGPNSRTAASATEGLVSVSHATEVASRPASVSESSDSSERLS